jgi:hypothetical protein
MPKERSQSASSPAPLVRKTTVTGAQIVTEEIRKAVDPHVHETMTITANCACPIGDAGFVVYDDKNTSEFYSRVEVDHGTATVMIPKEFAEPIIKGVDGNKVTLEVHDAKGKPKDTKTLMGLREKLFGDDFIFVSMSINRSTPKLCRMIIVSAYEHRVAVQATIPVSDD